MIKIYLFLFLLVSSGFGRAEVRIDLSFPQNQFKQGSLQEATLQIDMNSAQNFEIQKLKGLTAGDTVYFHKLSPLLRSNASGSLSSEVAVIFLKVPESNNIRFKTGDKEISLTWQDVEVLPTEAGKGFIFENFSIPSRKKILFWFILTLALIAIGALGYVINKRLKLVREEKKRRLKLKEEILEVQSYEGVIQVWQSKILYIKEFPHLEYAFKNLEKVLFKYVFKPVQNEQEKSEVLKAYRSFVSEIREGFNGI